MVSLSFEVVFYHLKGTSSHLILEFYYFKWYFVILSGILSFSSRILSFYIGIFLFINVELSFISDILSCHFPKLLFFCSSKLLFVFVLFLFQFKIIILLIFWRVISQWKGSNRKKSTRWQHISQLKASAVCIW